MKPQLPPGVPGWLHNAPIMHVDPEWLAAQKRYYVQAAWESGNREPRRLRRPPTGRPRGRQPKTPQD